MILTAVSYLTGSHSGSFVGLLSLAEILMLHMSTNNNSRDFSFIQLGLFLGLWGNRLTVYVFNHIPDFLTYLYKVGIQDAFFLILCLKSVEFGYLIVLIIGFLFLDFLHIEVGLTVELGSLELIRFLNVQ